MLKIKLLESASLLIALVLSASIFAIEDPVLTQSGFVSGNTVDSRISVYKGIPFAAPPVGNMRWKPPADVIPWNGVFQATDFGSVSPQLIGSSEESDEDSLYLNIWTPALNNNENLPVMVWFHGGAWTGGSGSMPIFDGEEFAKKGVILVTANYRLGALGFLAHPALSSESANNVSGNYGLLDNIAALKWVQRNISEFGGDPNNVTVFGESAGATNIYLLLTSPLAEGLFQKAISQSAWVSTTNITYLNKATSFSPSAEDIGRKAVDEYLRSVGISENASTEFSDKELLSIMRELTAEQTLNISFSETAAVDGWLIPDHPTAMYKSGLVSAVPIIVGINNGEGTFFASSNQFDSVEQQHQSKKLKFGKFADELLAFYGASDFNDIRKVEIEYITDEWFALPAREMLRATAAQGKQAYQYYFTRNRFSPSALAPHVAEVPYVFKYLNPDNTNTVDIKLSEIMNSYWIEFAKSGTPNNESLPRWTEFELDSEAYQQLDKDISSGSSLRKQSLDTLEVFLENSRLAQQAEISGTWTISVYVLGEYAGDSEITLVVKESGVLEGTYSGQLLNGPFEGTYENNNFEFSFDSDIGMSLTFKGSLSDSKEIEGSMESMGRVIGSFSGKR